VSTGKDRTRRIGCVSPNRRFLADETACHARGGARVVPIDFTAEANVGEFKMKLPGDLLK